METLISNSVRFQTTTVDGLDIFHREAGDPANPTILLLTGFPSSSLTFTDLINDLKDDFHLIAPDYPGFGYSSTPDAGTFSYSFDNLSNILEKWIDQIGLTSFNLYAHDYGGPIGFRIAARRPELIASLIIQNANAYAEGIGPGFGAAMPFLQNRNEETEKPIRGLMTLDGVKVFYFTGAGDATLINPDHYTLDAFFLSQPGRVEAHLDLLQNYTSNLGEFGTWQAYFREHQPKTLLAWGKNDPFFPEAAARAFLTDLPNADLHLFDASHFALEEYHAEIADLIKSFI